MIRWNEIVTLNEAFLPVCDIKDDDGFYWKQFICHNDFYKLLKNTINMYQKREKAVWLQGTFGSGKTHATTVIKNLFSKDLKDIKEYIEHSIKDVEIKPLLMSFRESYKSFPIILKGNYNISDSKTFSYAIQQEVVESLKNANINEKIQNIYDDMIFRIQNKPKFWQEAIENSRLIDEVINTNELIEELENRNDNILKLCEDELLKEGLGVVTNDIIKFLEDSAKILKEYGYDSITLFWDEFTPILEVDKYNEVFMTLQNIAENIKNENVYLFIVSHRSINRNRVLEDDIKKIHDRFELTHYQMEDITTYILLSNSLKKLNSYKQITDNFRDKEGFNDLINYVLNQENERVNYDNIFEMLPIHPYSGLILSLIARQLKSSERSIFKFLHDKSGFLRFLNESVNNLMDISYLWDYFFNIFEEDDKLHSYITRYVTSKEIEKVNPNYLVILKAILLLNILNRVVSGNEIVFQNILKPNRQNLEYIFSATKYSTILDKALELIDKKYIQKDVDGLFLVSSTILPEKEVSDEKDRHRDRSLLTILKTKESDLKKEFKNGILRVSEIDFRESNLKSHEIQRYVDKFQLDYSLKIMIFFAKEDSETLSIKNILKNLTKEDNNVIFVVVENSFTRERYNKFIDYKAREVVAKRHNHESESERNKIQAEKILEQYLNYDLKMSSVSIYYEDDIRNGVSLSNFSHEINLLAKKIYKYGADNSLVNGYKLWEKQNPTKTTPQNVIKSHNRDELNSNLIGVFKPLTNLLKDNNQNYILDDNFNIKDENSNHYLIKIIKKIESELKKRKKKEFHLGKVLTFLTKAPYGLYSNPISFVILSLALKKYEGKFYEMGSGKKIENLLLIDKIVEIFKSFENRSNAELRVRFGTEQEDRLIEILKELFSISDELGVVQLTFKIKEWIKEAKYPLWIVKYENSSENILELIDKLNDLINAHDEDISLNDIKKIVNLIDKNSLLIDLKILIDSARFENYFDKFIQSLNLNISKDEYEDIYFHIKRSIRANEDSDIAGWNEDRVKVLILEWHNRKLQNIANEKEKDKNSDIIDDIDKEELIPNNRDETLPKINTTPTINEIEQFKNEIKNLSLSSIVIANVDNDLELYRVLKKYI